MHKKRRVNVLYNIRQKRRVNLWVYSVIAAVSSATIGFGFLLLYSSFSAAVAVKMTAAAETIRATTAVIRAADTYEKRAAVRQPFVNFQKMNLYSVVEQNSSPLFKIGAAKCEFIAFGTNCVSRHTAPCTPQ